MYKHIFAIFFLLALVSACDSPYLVKFSNQFSHPKMSPKLAAIIAPDLGDRLEYGFHKLICPSKPLKSLDKAVSSIIEQEFFKNLISKFGPLENLEVVLEKVPYLLTDALSKEALGYANTKRSLEFAIGAAYASDYECTSLEKASELYFSYDKSTYLSDLCGSGDTLKTILNLLEKSKKTSLKATSLDQTKKTAFMDIFKRNEFFASMVVNGGLTRIQALGLLVDDLSTLPLCHESTTKYTNILKKLAASDDPIFFSLYDSVVDFRINCPLTFSGFYLVKIEDDVLYFSDGVSTYPLLTFLENENSVVERYKDAPLTFNISGTVPLSTYDEFFDTSVIPEKETKKLNVGKFSIIALFGALMTGLYIRAKKT
ncbi:MAG: hypothetical protein GOU98_04225 [Candidatus Altiarchaeota archaeon]|nr:hypothetical protein [Candidatus Altiarchaeota archaeon]